MKPPRGIITAAALSVSLLFAVAGPAMAQAYDDAPPYPPPPPPRFVRPPPFGQGAVNVGGSLGFGSSGKSVAFTLGLNLGYFVLDGLEPGIFSDVTFGSEIETQISVLPYLRYVFYRSWRFSPFIKAQGGGLFFVDGPNLALVGGGGGFVWGLGGNLGLNIEALVFKLLPESECPPDDDCIRYNFGVSLSYLFGGASQPMRAAPPPPPPMQPAAPPASSPPAPTTPEEPGAPGEPAAPGGAEAPTPGA